MVVRHHADEVVRIEQERRDARIARPALHDGQIDAVIGQHFIKILNGISKDRYASPVSAGARVLAEDLGDDARLGRVGDPDPDAGHFPGGVGELLAHLVVQRLDAPGVFQGDFPLRGGPKGLFSAHEELRAEVFLEGGDVMGDRGLGEGERLGGLGEVLLFGNGEESFESLGEHGRAPFRKIASAGANHHET